MQLLLRPKDLFIASSSTALFHYHKGRGFTSIYIALQRAQLILKEAPRCAQLFSTSTGRSLIRVVI